MKTHALEVAIMVSRKYTLDKMENVTKIVLLANMEILRQCNVIIAKLIIAKIVILAQLPVIFA